MYTVAFIDVKLADQYCVLFRVYYIDVFFFRNPQTSEFCAKLGIRDLNEMLCAQSREALGVPYFLSEMSDAVKDEQQSAVTVDIDRKVSFVLSPLFLFIVGGSCRLLSAIISTSQGHSFRCSFDFCPLLPSACFWRQMLNF